MQIRRKTEPQAKEQTMPLEQAHSAADPPDPI